MVGEVTDEGYNYSVSHPISSPSEVGPTLRKYFPDRIANKMMKCFQKSETEGEARFLLDSLLSAGLVNLPIRLLHKDLFAAGFPVIRYRIEWVPEQLRPVGMLGNVFHLRIGLIEGYIGHDYGVCGVVQDCVHEEENKGHIPHASDRVIWSMLTPLMTSDQVDVARRWLKTVQDEIAALKAQKLESRRDVRTMLKLSPDRKIEWSPDYGTYNTMVSLYIRDIPALPAFVTHNVTHLQDELSSNNDRISVVTHYGPVIGGRTSNGVAVFLGMTLSMHLFPGNKEHQQRYRMLFLPSGLWTPNLCLRIIDTKRKNISRKHHVMLY